MTSSVPMSSCKACDASGLPIVFLFHGALALDEAFAPAGSAGLQPHQPSISRLGLPPLSKARYVLRSLRPHSFVHIWHEKPPESFRKRAAAVNAQRAKAKQPTDPEEAHWEVLRVLPGGALVPPSHPYFAQGEPFTCSQDGGSHIYTAMTYRLPEAHEAGTIKVAVSANLWDAKLRAQNLADPEAMTALSMPMLLTGGLWPGIYRPDAAWLHSHVADFALDGTGHGRQSSRVPLVRVKGYGQKLIDRMKALAAQHPKTQDKGFVCVLPDPVGSAEALAEISLHRQAEGLTWAQTQAHPLAAATRIDMLRKGAVDDEAQRLASQMQARQLDPDDLYTRHPTAPQALLNEADTAATKPLAQSGQWSILGYHSYQVFADQKRPGGDLPASARYLPLARQSGTGMVIAPTGEVLKLRSQKGARKIDRLHDAKAKQAFQRQFDQTTQKYLSWVDGHDDDRKQLLEHARLGRVMKLHFDPQAPNRHADEHKPGLAYLSECNRALVGASTCSKGLLAFIQTLMKAEISSEQGWALRGLVANQQALFSPLADGLSFSVDWLTNPDAKLDKAYDTFKSLVTDDWSAGYLKTRFGWMTPIGVGLSFGLQGFFAGAAGQMVANLLAPSAQSAAQKGVAVAGQVRNAAHQASSTALTQLNSAQGKLAQKFQTWCHHQSLILQGLLDNTPPPRPVRVRIDLDLAGFVALAERLERAGQHLNRTTRELLAQVRGLPSSALTQTVSVDLLSTDADLHRSASVSQLAQSASHARVAVRSDVAGLPRLLHLDANSLAELFRRAHRFDVLKEAAVKAVARGLPMQLGYVSSALTAAVRGVQGALAPGGAAQKAGQIAVGTAQVGSKSSLSVFGAWLQWRLHEGNEAKLDAWRAKLQAQGASMNAEQRQILQTAIGMTELAYWDNKAGILGGVAEVTAIGAAEVMRASSGWVKPGAMWVAATGASAAAFAGATGAFLNAAANFRKAAEKRADGDWGLANAYDGVAVLYRVAGVSLGAAGVEILYGVWKYRALLELGIKGAASAAAGATAARFGQGIVLRGLSLTGWGLAFTVAAYAVEGIVAYHDHSDLEKWVKNCYFGTEPKWKSGKDAQKAEEQAFGEAMNKAAVEGRALETPGPASSAKAA